MTLDDETLAAYLDGELSEAEMDRITDLIASSPEAAARLEALRASDAWLTRQFAAMDRKPIRQNTLDLIENAGLSKNTGLDENPSLGENPESDPANETASEDGTANVVTFRPRSRMATMIADNLSWGHAVAASVALFVGVGTGMQLSAPQNGHYASQQTAGLITPASPLFDVLERTPSLTAAALDTAGETTAMPLMSFRAKEGGYCREFQVASATAHSRNVACKDNSGWLIKVTVASAGPAPAANGGFTPASTQENALVDSTVLGLMAGDALDRKGEQTLIDHGWRNTTEEQLNR